VRLTGVAAAWCLRGSCCFLGMLVLTGCISRTLDIGYDGSRTGPGALASLPSRRVIVPAVTDKRVAADGTRVHEKVFSARPVPDVVRDAVILEVKGNGHTAVNESGDWVFAVDVEKLWVDTVAGFWTAQFVGVASIRLTVRDGKTGRVLANRTYHGVQRETVDNVFVSVQRALSGALGRVAREIGTDETLARTLKDAAE